MESEPGSVAVGEDETSAVRSVNSVGVVVDLIEEMRQQLGMGRRADAVVDLGHVGHMRLIRLVQVDTIPAAGEVELRTQAIRAVRVGDVGGFGCWVIVINAGEADAIGNGPGLKLAVAVGQGIAVVGPGRAVSRKDLEAARERNNVETVLASTQVVDHSAVGGDVDEGAIALLIVEQRRPVCAQVLLDRTGCARGGSQRVKGGRGVDIWLWCENRRSPSGVGVVWRYSLIAPESIWTWPEMALGFTRGSTRPTWAMSQFMRQKASAVLRHESRLRARDRDGVCFMTTVVLMMTEGLEPGPM